MKLTDAQIEALTPDERCDLIARLGGVRRVPVPASYARRVRRMRMAMMVPSTLVLIPWIIYLAMDLPVQYTAANWRLTWVGFDVVLLILMVLTVILGWRRRQLVLLTAFATGILLLCDAWFDVTTALPADRPVALASALLAETPLALVLIVGALRFVRLIAEQQGLLTRDKRLWHLRLPLVIEDE